MLGEGGGDVREIEDDLDRLEAWHRRTAPSDDANDDDRSEVPVRR
jgi:hypothetical protein